MKTKDLVNWQVESLNHSSIQRAILAAHLNELVNETTDQ
jgi:hypothetical protein